MAIEIERKFLVLDDAWRAAAGQGEAMVQGYLAGPPAAGCSVRVRIVGERAWLNIKSAESGIVRQEFEYPLPLDDARGMLASLAGPLVEKSRYRVAFQGRVFEVDEFHGTNAGLVLAELELEHVDEPFPRPPWLGLEVSDDHRYYNHELALHPWCDWEHRAGAPG